MGEDWQTGQAPRVEVPSTSGAIVRADASADPSDVEAHKWLAIIAYLGPLVFVALLLGRQSRYARFHLNQGLVLAITLGVCWVVGLMLDVFLAFIPIIGWMVAACIPLTLFVTWTGLAISGVLNAVNGRTLPLPGIGTAFTVLR
jgi:uncharacterized membrane protein